MNGRRTTRAKAVESISKHKWAMGLLNTMCQWLQIRWCGKHPNNLFQSHRGKVSLPAPLSNYRSDTTQTMARGKKQISSTSAGMSQRSDRGKSVPRLPVDTRGTHACLLSKLNQEEIKHLIHYLNSEVMTRLTSLESKFNQLELQRTENSGQISLDTYRGIHFDDSDEE